MLEKEIGKRIQQIRKKKGITQEALAEKLSISTNYYSALERGVYNIKLEFLVDIMNELDCSADEVFCDVVNKSLSVRSTRLSEKLAGLPLDEQRRIYDVVDTMIKSAK